MLKRLLSNMDYIRETWRGRKGGWEAWYRWGAEAGGWACVEHTEEQQMNKRRSVEGEEGGNEQDGDETVPVMIILAQAGTFGWDGKQDAILCSIHVGSVLASVPPHIHMHSHIQAHTKHTLAERGRSLWFQSSDSGL